MGPQCVAEYVVSYSVDSAYPARVAIKLMSYFQIVTRHRELAREASGRPPAGLIQDLRGFGDRMGKGVT